MNITVSQLTLSVLFVCRYREACPVHRGGATHEGGEHPTAEKASERNGAQGGPVQTTVRE